MPHKSESLERPIQLRLPAALKRKIARIAEVNHLSEVDVIRLCLQQGVPAIETNGLTILPPKQAR